MDYNCVNLDNMDLYFVKTKKFKSIDIKIFFCDEVCKDDVTWRNCLMDVLSYATKKYPTRKDFSIHLNDLYSLYLTASNMRFGNYLISKIGVSFLNPKYTEEGIIEKSLELLREIIFEPLVINNHFNKEYLDFIKMEQKADTETIKEDSKGYSSIRLLENMDSDMPYTISGYSDLSVLEKINENNLYEYYQKFIRNNKVFVIIVGDVDEKQITKYFKDNFPFIKKTINKQIVIEHQNIRQEANVIIEDSFYQQSKLAVSFKFKDLTDFEYRYVLNIYNSILGGSVDNKLMRLIREENSLAYYIRSNISKADQLMFINSGIDSKNFEKVVQLMNLVLDDIKNGNITEQEIMKGKLDYISSFDVAMETSNGYIDIILGQILFMAHDVETRKEEIMKVTKEDIMKLSQKIKIDTIYLLKGA